jgi:hypothetical protein
MLKVSHVRPALGGSVKKAAKMFSVQAWAQLAQLAEISLKILIL